MMQFQKMHGLGNDFIFLNDIDLTKYDLHKLAIQLCNRNTGIGADGIVLILPSKKADVRMRIVNADGSEADMCGNAIRCFAKLVYETGMIQKESFKIETFAGIIIPELIIEDDIVQAVRVNMGEPKLKRADIPMTGKKTATAIHFPLKIGKKTFHITSLLMGVPHTMVFVDNLDEVDIVGIGRQIEKHAAFPKGTNVNFVEVINQEEIKLRTWERGAGSTLACGTGSCASAVASALNGKTGKQVTVHLALGDLFIDWSNEHVYMTGPATNVFSGEIEI
ncbi:MAG TPA: diaminopimelate epimerase [Prolixibacteraceae bacterium]|nr:diaminopimelate epimerase [Prolixibacteraceae bacterium]